MRPSQFHVACNLVYSRKTVNFIEHVNFASNSAPVWLCQELVGFLNSVIMWNTTNAMASTIPVSERDPDRQVCIWFAEVIHLTGSVHPISFLYGKV